jgi:hypothetical protein
MRSKKQNRYSPTWFWTKRVCEELPRWYTCVGVLAVRIASSNWLLEDRNTVAIGGAQNWDQVSPSRDNQGSGPWASVALEMCQPSRRRGEQGR